MEDKIEKESFEASDSPDADIKKSNNNLIIGATAVILGIIVIILFIVFLSGTKEEIDLPGQNLSDTQETTEEQDINVVSVELEEELAALESPTKEKVDLIVAPLIESGKISCELKGDDVDAVLCYAGITKDYSYCDLLNETYIPEIDSTQKSVCYTHAMSYDNVKKDMCDKLYGADNRNKCLAYVNDDISYCDKLSDNVLVIECKYAITKDRAYCDQEETEYLKNLCIINHDKPPVSQCERYDEETKQECYYILEGRKDYCLNYENSDDLYLNICLGKPNKDTNYCNMFNCFEDTKSKAYEFVALNHTKKEFCDYVTHASPLECYDKLDRKTTSNHEKTAEDCKSLHFDIYKDQCFFNLVEVDFNAEHCNNINDEDVKQACNAIASRDLELCYSLDKSEVKISCLASFIEEKGPEICDRLSSPEKEDCLSIF